MRFVKIPNTPENASFGLKLGAYGGIVRDPAPDEKPCDEILKYDFGWFK